MPDTNPYCRLAHRTPDGRDYFRRADTLTRAYTETDVFFEYAPGALPELRRERRTHHLAIRRTARTRRRRVRILPRHIRADHPDCGGRRHGPALPTNAPGNDGRD